MDDKRYSFTGVAALSLPLYEADKLLSEADGTLALVYLYILRNGGNFSTVVAARELKLNDSSLETAVLRLAELGLISPCADERLSSAPELPEYNSEQVAARGGQSEGFKVVVGETQRIFGRMLSSSELKQLFGIYDHLGLPAEVMLLLINYCVTEHRAKYGGARLPTLRKIEQEGFRWADFELLTLEQAEVYIHRSRERSGDISRLKRTLSIGTRELTATERKYTESWFELGFSIEALEIAYDRTVTQTGQLKWAYMNSIIKSWHEKDLHTPGEIEAGDGSSGKYAKRASKSDETEYKPGELEHMKKILNKISNG